MTKYLIAAILGLSMVVVAEDAPKLIKPKPVSPELRAKFWRASSEFITIRAQYEQAQARLQAAHAALCAAPDTPILGSDGEPTCQAKPEEKKPEAKK